MLSVGVLCLSDCFLYRLFAFVPPVWFTSWYLVIFGYDMIAGVSWFLCCMLGYCLDILRYYLAVFGFALSFALLFGVLAFVLRLSWLAGIWSLFVT